MFINYLMGEDMAKKTVKELEEQIKFYQGLLDDAQRKNIELKKENEKLKSLLDQKPTEAAGVQPKRGRRAKITDELKKRVGVLYRDGLTVRQIAEQENISVGTVSKILNM